MAVSVGLRAWFMHMHICQVGALCLGPCQPGSGCCGCGPLRRLASPLSTPVPAHSYHLAHRLVNPDRQPRKLFIPVRAIELRGGE